MTENTQEVITSGKFTITKDLKLYWIKIVATSKQYRGGQKVIYNRPFTRDTSPERRLAAMDRYVESFLQAETEGERIKAEKRAARNEARASVKNPYRPGDILYHSWGYDQTNIDFYQVTAITASSIKVRPIDQNKNGYDRGTTVAIKDAFTGDEQTRRVQYSITPEGAHADVRQLHRWDGQPLTWTGYA